MPKFEENAYPQMIASGGRSPLLLCCAFAFALGVVFINSGQTIFNEWPTPLTIAPDLSRIQLNPSPALYGRHILTSLGVLLVVGAVIVIALYWLSYCKVDYFSLGIFVVAALTSLYHIHLSKTWPRNDMLEGHYNYIAYIRHNWLTPWRYHGGEGHQPPFYYYVAAGVFCLSEYFPAIDACVTLRFLSWSFYLVFCGFGLLTLRKMDLSGAGYYASAALLLLWPRGLVLASIIGNDTFYYAWYAAAFYYAVLWYQSGIQRQLLLSLALAGIALTARFNGLILFAVIGILMGVSWFRGRFCVRSLFSKPWITVGVILGICYLVGFGKVIDIHHPLPLSIPDGDSPSNYEKYPLPFFLSLGLQDALLHPYSCFSMKYSADNSFAGCLLGANLFGDYEWLNIPNRNLILLIFLSYLMVFYTFAPWFAARRAQWRGMLPAVIGFVLQIMSMVVFVLNRQRSAGLDIRYIYPALICFAIWFGRSHALYKSQGAFLLTVTGPVLAWSFVSLGLLCLWGIT